MLPIDPPVATTYGDAMDYAMFLRGVNVGGIKVESAKLRQVLTGLGLTDVTTYLASGNVTFGSDAAAATLTADVERALSDAFHYDAHVLVFRRSTLAAVVTGYPFAHDPGHHRYAVFCDSPATAADLAGAGGAEEVSADGPVVYWRCPRGSTLATPFAKVLARRAYQAVTTTRNLNTVEKMVAPPA